MPRYRFLLLTSGGRLALTSHSELDNDDHATLFADGVLRAAEPSVTAIEAWHGTKLLFKRERG